MAGKRIRYYSAILLITLIALFYGKASVQAAEAQFKITADSTEFTVGVGSNLVVSLINAKDARVTEIKGLENFDTVSQDQSEMTQTINGSTTNQTDINYVIMPKATGEFTLQASVEYDGKTYQTNELKVKVSEAENNPDQEKASDLFLKTVLSGDEIYFGQKLVLTYELYTRYNMENYGFLDNVSIDGFVLNEAAEDKLKSEYVTIGDDKYAKYEAKQLYLSPVAAGTYTIPSFNFQANVSTGSFFQSSKPVYLQSEAKNITVKPLPQDNKPEDFSGIVGKLNIEAGYDKQQLEYGDSLTLHVTASGNCNLDGVDSLVKGSIPGFKAYESLKSSEEGIKDKEYFSSKEFDIILVPENTGDITIPSITIPYFNTETQKYEKAEIPGATIAVSGEKSRIDSQEQQPAYKTLEISQVSYDRQGDGYLTIRLNKNVLFIGLAIAGLFGIFVVLVLILLRQRKQGDKTLLKLNRQISKAKHVNEIYAAFNDMMKYSLGISIKASSRDSIIQYLNKAGEHGYELAVPVMEAMDQIERVAADEGMGSLKTKMKGIYKKLVKMKKLR